MKKQFYACPYCSREFNHPVGLASHMRGQHNKPYIRPRTLTARDHQTLKPVSTADEKPLQCPQCSRTFRYEAHLARHVGASHKPANVPPAQQMTTATNVSYLPAEVQPPQDIDSAEQHLVKAVEEITAERSAIAHQIDRLEELIHRHGVLGERLDALWIALEKFRKPAAGAPENQPPAAAAEQTEDLKFS